MSVDDCDAKIRSRQSPSAMGRYGTVASGDYPPGAWRRVSA